MILILINYKKELESFEIQGMNYVSYISANEQIFWFKWLEASPVLIIYENTDFWIVVVSVLYMLVIAKFIQTSRLKYPASTSTCWTTSFRHFIGIWNLTYLKQNSWFSFKNLFSP